MGALGRDGRIARSIADRDDIEKYVVGGADNPNSSGTYVWPDDGQKV